MSVAASRGALSSWMFEFSTTCPDPGLKAFMVLDEAQVRGPRIVIWIGVLLAAEQISHAIVLLLTARRPVRFLQLKTRPFELPVGLALVWVIFTGLSIFLVAMTFRSNAAILAKSIHVATEAGFLVLLSASFGCYLFAGLVASLVLIVLLLVTTLNCDETVLFAATSGLILDSINFLAYAWYGFTRPNDQILWLLIGGLGWHGMYLLTQLEVMRYEVDGLTKLWFRVVGMIFNVVADEFVLAAVRRTLLDTRSGTLSMREWAVDRDPHTEPYCVWTAKGLRLIGPVPEGETRRLHAFEPHRTAYTPRAMLYALNAFVPFFGEIRYHREGDITTVWHAVGCAFGWLRSRQVLHINARIPERAYVLTWLQVRAVFWILLILLGVVLGFYP